MTVRYSCLLPCCHWTGIIWNGSINQPSGWCKLKELMSLHLLTCLMIWGHDTKSHILVESTGDWTGTKLGVQQEWSGILPGIHVNFYSHFIPTGVHWESTRNVSWGNYHWKPPRIKRLRRELLLVKDKTLRFEPATYLIAGALTTSPNSHVSLSPKELLIVIIKDQRY